MDAPSRAPIFSLLAVLAITTVLYGGGPRRSSWTPFVTGALPHADPPGTTSILDAGAGPLSIPNAALEPVGWGDLDGWTSDDHAVALATFNVSCRAIERAAAFRAESAGNHAAVPQSVRAALEQVCIRAIKAGSLESEAARQFFETNFVPVRIRKLGDSAGFLTGYYDPIVDGSRFSTREFTVPLYRRPRDLVAPGVAEGGPFPNTGRAFRRSPAGKLVPYFDRAEIEDGALDGRHLEICWLRKPANALSIELEGSGRVRLEDGSMLRISYDAHNGYSYVPAGRALIERHLVPRTGVSPEHIRQWLHDHPEGAKEVRRQNRQVVFFRVVGLGDDTETIGGQGVPLSPWRSIAVDKALHRYGTPFFIEAELPLTSAVNRSSFRRVMIAQDTGSAIVGPARADLYFGAGNEAGQVADRVRQSGRFTILLPREIDPTVAGTRAPLPPVKAPRSEPAAHAIQSAKNSAGSEERTADVATNPRNTHPAQVPSTRDQRPNLTESPWL
jgi:membrane-bound lytic murein transglycosylase A